MGGIIRFVCPSTQCAPLRGCLPWFCCFVMFIAYCTMGELLFAPTWLPTVFLLFCVIHCKSHVATWANCDVGELLFAPTIF